MKQQIIHRASSGLLYCLCNCVICRIQQFPCNKLLKKRYVIPRYNNLCAVKVKFVINFSLTLTFILILTFLLSSSFCLSKVEHLLFKPIKSDQHHISPCNIGGKNQGYDQKRYDVLILQQLLPITSGKTRHEMRI